MFSLIIGYNVNQIIILITIEYSSANYMRIYSYFYLIYCCLHTGAEIYFGFLFNFFDIITVLFAFLIDALTDGFSCPDGDVIGPNGRILPHPTFAHPDDCQKFYICRNGVTPQYGSCSSGLVYNEISFKCDDPDNVPGW